MNEIKAHRRERPDDMGAGDPVVELKFKADRNSLSFKASKLLHLLVNAAGPDLTQPVRHRIALQDARETAQLSDAAIKESTIELLSTSIEITTWRPLEQWLVGSILSDAAIMPEQDDLEFQFSDTMQTIFAADDGWEFISAQLMFKFDCLYTLRLYELISLSSEREQQWAEFNIDDFRLKIGVEPGKLTLFEHFRAQALDPAVEELNRRTGMHVKYNLFKNGRVFKAIRLRWGRDAAEADTKAAIETKSVALTHRAAAVPAVAGRPVAASPKGPPSSAVARPTREMSFPVFGSISHDHYWGKLAKETAPTHDPDTIAMEFRAHCLVEDIALDGPGIQLAFTGYCYVYRRAKRTRVGAK